MKVAFSVFWRQISESTLNFLSKMEKQNKKLEFPNFFRWTFEKWYFWLIVFISSLWTGAEELGLGYISEFIGILIANFIFVGLFFLIAYFIARNRHKNLLKKINEKK